MLAGHQQQRQAARSLCAHDRGCTRGGAHTRTVLMLVVNKCVLMRLHKATILLNLDVFEWLYEISNKSSCRLSTAAQSLLRVNC